jgi:GNAT superfamily N-acetyltransferase
MTMAQATDTQIDLVAYSPGAIGRVTEMHATYYHSRWSFGLHFESRIATDLAAFLRRFNSARDGFWLASCGGKIVGSIAIDGAGAQLKGAHLRWFIVDEGMRRHGIGTRLMETALQFARDAGHANIHLWTFAGLDEARRLYEKYGFRLITEHHGDQWGKPVQEQQFLLSLEPAA